MDNIVSHLDIAFISLVKYGFVSPTKAGKQNFVPRLLEKRYITRIFCEVDDFCQSFENPWQEQPMLPSMLGERKSRSRMRLSEVMTIVLVFHGSGYKTFKEFYTLTVIPFWRKAFPHLVSYSKKRDS